MMTSAAMIEPNRIAASRNPTSAAASSNATKMDFTRRNLPAGGRAA